MLIWIEFYLLCKMQWLIFCPSVIMNTGNGTKIYSHIVPITAVMEKDIIRYILETSLCYGISEHYEQCS